MRTLCRVRASAIGNSRVALVLVDKSLIESRHRRREYRVAADPTLYFADLIAPSNSARQL